MQPDVANKEFLVGPPDNKWRISRTSDKEWHIYQSSLRFGSKWKLVDVVKSATVDLDPTGRAEWILWLLENLANESTGAKSEVPNSLL